MKKNIVRRVGKIFLATMMFVMLMGMMVSAASKDQYTLKLQGGTYCYNKAYEMLPMVNQARKSAGLATLKMDANLMKAAMQRAAESSVDFSHKRPNGKMCYTVNKKVYGENLAAGNTTARDTFEQWMNSPGHRANIMAGRFKSVGIGCYDDGEYCYWVQLFGDGKAVTGKTMSNQKVKPSVAILEGWADLECNVSQETMDEGETLQLKVSRVNPGWQDCSRAYFSNDSFVWTSSNTSVAVVNQNGQVKAVGDGIAVIKGVPKKGKGEGIKVTILCQ